MELTKTESNLNKKRRARVVSCVLLFLLMFLLHIQAVNMCKEAFPMSPIPSAFLNFSTDSFHVSIQEFSQTVTALCPLSDPEFNFTTGEWIDERKGDGYYQLGDLTFRTKTADENEWKSYSTAVHRSPVEKLNGLPENVLAAAKLNNTLPQDVPLEATRYWEKNDGKLVLRFELKNIKDKNVEIGALGIPMVFNNILHKKHLDEVHEENVFFDPYIGMDAGYLQVIRLSGEGPALLVLPHSKTPFEAYRPLLDDPMPRGITFEGFHEWMVHSKAYAENEWKSAEQWNKATSKILSPGEVYEIGIEFVLAKDVQEIEKTLTRYNRPLAVGIPGYVLPQDVEGKLFLRYGKKVQEIKVEPEGSLFIEKQEITSDKWANYLVKGNKLGRARVSIIYDDGILQTIHYKVIKPESDVVADNGRFLTSEQWFDDFDDPFKRAPSVITYDYEKKEQVTQDGRVWIAGLSDEGGAGSWLNAIMKQLIQPDPLEVGKMEDFVNQTLWGGIQYSEGNWKYGVRKSLFYYEPDSMPQDTYREDIDYSTWSAWSKKEAESVGRSYNYPHVTAAHWVMYRLARNYKGLVTQRPWEWYLNRAFQTAMAMIEYAPYYAQFGQMEGTVFLFVLDDLQREGWSGQAKTLESVMKKRAEHWFSLNYPFGSEMPWDSTGQEEVYMWSKYFGFDQKAAVTLKAILAYMPTLPHWGYNGCARRYWDFLYAGKLSRIERQIHHYGSALNAIPVLHAFKETPNDFYLLRVGYGGLMGALSNITEEGFAPCAFHSFPSTLCIDGISGDYGPGFFGYAVNTASFLVHHNDFGWLAFGGNVTQKSDWITMEATTAARSRIFIAAEGIELALDAGQFRLVSYHPQTGKIRIVLEPANEFTPQALLRITPYPDGDSKKYIPKGFSKNNRDLYEIPLITKEKIVEIQRE